MVSHHGSNTDQNRYVRHLAERVHKLESQQQEVKTVPPAADPDLSTDSDLSLPQSDTGLATGTVPSGADPDLSTDSDLSPLQADPLPTTHNDAETVVQPIQVPGCTDRTTFDYVRIAIAVTQQESNDNESAALGRLWSLAITVVCRLHLSCGKSLIM